MDSEFSALNSVNPGNIKNFRLKNYEIKRVQTTLFYKLVKNNFDFLNIDCEGNDLKILKTIDLKKYTPEIINIDV